MWRVGGRIGALSSLWMSPLLGILRFPGTLPYLSVQSPPRAEYVHELGTLGRHYAQFKNTSTSKVRIHSYPKEFIKCCGRPWYRLPSKVVAMLLGKAPSPSPPGLVGSFRPIKLPLNV
ncbi:hypothetical protein GGS20DRAFT_534163 [Poronia punctata]|nr:hypothetical protein GGS20DRAFT_534163 [Poronia punctata]